jgi:hypothetical protein
MAGKHGGTRVGVCVVRVETDASAGLLITVTSRRDVRDHARETTRHTATVEGALECVAEFLASLDQIEL